MAYFICHPHEIPVQSYYPMHERHHLFGGNCLLVNGATLTPTVVTEEHGLQILPNAQKGFQSWKHEAGRRVHLYYKNRAYQRGLLVHHVFAADLRVRF